MEKLARQFSDNPEQILPEAGALESAKNYRKKKAKPILAKVVKVLRSVYSAYMELCSKFERLQQSYYRECSKTAQMSERIESLAGENRYLRGIAADFDRLKKALGRDKVEEIIESSKIEEIHQWTRKRKQHSYER